MVCTLTIEAMLKSNKHFDCRYQELCNACIFRLVYIVLNVLEMELNLNILQSFLSEYI